MRKKYQKTGEYYKLGTTREVEGEPIRTFTNAVKKAKRLSADRDEVVYIWKRMGLVD